MVDNNDAVNNVYETRTCKECGCTFTILKSEVEDLKQRCGDKFALPLRCHDCRAKKGQIYRTCKCKKCGNDFTISLLEKDDYIRKGLDLPKHCSDCRAKMRNRRKKINSIPETISKIPQKVAAAMTMQETAMVV